MVFGVAVGHVIILAWYLYLLRRSGFIRISAVWRVNGTLLKAFWFAVGIVLIGELFYQLYGIALRSIASRFGVGTISSFYYATSLMLLPFTLIITPLLTIAYPRMTEAFHQDRSLGVKVFIKASIFLVAFSLLAAACLAIFANGLVDIVFVRGNFSSESGAKTAHVLTIIAMSLPLLSINRLGRYALYSVSDYKTSMFANLFSLLSLLAFSWALIPDMGVDGLAIAVVLAAFVSMLWTILMLRARIPL